MTYPTLADRLYTFLLLEVETGTVHWMIINIPGSRLASGRDKIINILGSRLTQ